jgi:hypothetical protein
MCISVTTKLLPFVDGGVLDYGIGSEEHAVTIFRVEVKAEAAGFFETLITTHHTVRCHNLEEYNMNLLPCLRKSLFCHRLRLAER